MRVIVVGDDPLARAGLSSLLDARAELEVVDQRAADGALTRSFQALQPEAVVWDLGGDLSASDWKEDLADLVESGASVVVLLADSSQAPEAWASGALGLLDRQADPGRIAAAVQAVANGLAAIEPELTPQSGLDSSVETLVEDLTDRERQVLGLMAEGLANKSIAHRLEITEHTVKFHVNSILRKLGAQSRTEAVVRATRMGLILL